MKICFCLGGLFFSGAENVVRFLCEELIGRGYDVSAILLKSIPKESERIKGLTIESAIVNDGGVMGPVRRIKAIHKALKKLQPDAFVIFSYASSFTAVPAAWPIKGTKIYVCERNDPTSVPVSKKRRFARDMVFRFADVCVSQTSVIAQYFDHIAENNAVIPNPIREPGVMCDDVAMRKNVFATVARLDDYQKNQTMMIRAFANVLKKHPEYELHFLGNGPDYDKYKAFISELGVEQNIKLLGNVEKPIEYIKECRGFLLSSHYEGMPNALVEAMSIGLPCVATDCLGGGAAALMTDGENGFLVERNDEAAFTEKIIRLIEDDDLCRRLGAKAFEINETLKSDKIVAMWEKIFEEHACDMRRH